MKRVLVIGGTGTMGKPLVCALYKKNYFVEVVCRHAVDDSRQIKYHIGDAKDQGFIKEVLSNKYDVIVDFCMYTATEFAEHYDDLLSSCYHYVCLSSSAVYANIDGPKKENSPRYMEVDPPQAGTEKFYWYCYEKARIEDMLCTSKYKNWTIVRPGMTMNDNHFFWGNWIDEEWSFRILHNKKVVIPKDMLSFKASITYGGDITQMFMAIIESPEAIGEIYNVISNTIYSWQDLLRLYSDVFKKHGIEMKVHYVDSCEEILKYYKDDRYIYERARLLDRVFDNTKICSLMKDYTFTSIETKIEEWVNSYIKLYPQKIRNPYVMPTVYLDRLSYDITNKKYFSSDSDYLRYCLFRFFPFIVYAIRFLRRLIN